MSKQGTKKAMSSSLWSTITHDDRGSINKGAAVPLGPPFHIIHDPILKPLFFLTAQQPDMFADMIAEQLIIRVLMHKQGVIHLASQGLVSHHVSVRDV